MTVFNRKDQTMRCLRSLMRQGGDTARFVVFVVDDASTDGTGEAIASEFPEVRLLEGSGDLYWNGGMRLGLEAAMAEGFDFYWWLNDDVALDEDALSRLLSTADLVSRQQDRPSIVVGSMRDPDRGHVTYGGVVREHRWRPLHFTLVVPNDDEPLPALTMNGNCVLIPEQIAHDLGNISPEFRQKMGDFDYGLRAQEDGYGVWVAPGTLGACALHPPRRTDQAPLAGELRRLWSIKELPFGPWKTYTSRWGGPLWPLYFVSPYVNRSIRLFTERLRLR